MSDPELAPLLLADGELLWAAQFLPAPIADAALLALQKQIVWERHHLRIFGRQTPAPRLSCWIGDPDFLYAYVCSPIRTAQLIPNRSRGALRVGLAIIG